MEQEQDVAPPTLNAIYCLMESDSLVSSLDVETERLLFPTSTHQHDVHLVIEVSLRVLLSTLETTACSDWWKS